MSNYVIEVVIRGIWSPLKSSAALNLTRERACDLITRVRRDSAKTISGLRFRIRPTDIINLEDEA